MQLCVSLKRYQQRSGMYATIRCRSARNPVHCPDPLPSRAFKKKEGSGNETMAVRRIVGALSNESSLDQIKHTDAACSSEN